MKQLFTRILALTGLLLFNSSLIAQVGFTNSNNLLSNPNFHSGVAIAVVDMNNDGMDDIVRMGEGYLLTIEHQHADSAFHSMELMAVADDSEWSMCVADIDNNGYNDVLTGGYYNDVKIVKANEDGTAYEMSTLPGQTLFIQGSNFADINNDGWVDVFACHDDAESRIWSNNAGTGFETADDLIDMTTVPASDNSGNYGSVWTDFDNDGDLDLYIAKCRQGVNDPTDPRRINALYVNDGNNVFTEAAEAHGLKIGYQSWTADFQDIDNDGDMDCFVTNHDHNCQLLLNDGSGYFTDISEGSGVDVTGLPVQGVMRDFDNDGFVDILVAGSEDHLFMNNGDLTFTEVTNIFDNNEMESYALGDLNSDGFVDIYGGYAGIYTNPSNIDDVIWMNNGNDNNHFAVRLSGTESNKAGIGARIEIYGTWGVQVREVRSGESYGIMNSLNQYFGLGAATEVNFVVVKWPSGIVDLIANPEINNMITIEEGATCVDLETAITVSGSTTICDGDTVSLSAEPGYTYLWSNGATTADIEVTEAGVYSVIISDSMNCFGIAPGIEIIQSPDETPEILVEGVLEFCAGEFVTLTATEADSYTWSNGATTQSIEVTESGVYNVTIPGVCQDFSSDLIGVNVLEIPEAPTAEDVTILEAQSVTLEASGGNVFWYDALEGGNLLASGNSFETPEITETTTFYVEDVNQVGGAISFGGPEDNSGGGGENPPNFNGWIYFNAYEDFTLLSVTLYAYGNGDRTIQLLNSNDEVLQEVTLFVVSGESRVDLNFEIPAGTNYVLRTPTDPSMFRNNAGVSYPYPIGDMGSLGAITNSRYGVDYYYYFYNWEVEASKVACPGDRSEVTVFWEPSSVKGLEENTVSIFPNPGQGIFTLQTDLTSDVSLRVLSLDGKEMHVEESVNAAAIQSYDLDIQHLPEGIYLLQIKAAAGTGIAKLVKF